MARPEYMRIHSKYFSSDIHDLYVTNALIDYNGYA